MSVSPPTPNQRPSQTKIVATVGPASSSQSILAELIAAGVDVFRINTAHADRQEHEARLEAIRQASRTAGQPVGVLVDLAGPKIRLGELPGGQMQCLPEARVSFVRGPISPEPGQLTTTYGPLIDELSPGDRVMLADGTVTLLVEEVGEDGARCRVVQPGLIRSRQGVNLPGVRLSVPTLGEVDRQNAVWAGEHGVDFVGLSFVRSPDEIHQLKSLLQSHGSDAQVIAKIEKPEALDRLEEIVKASDGVMVARGDLGVEIDIAQIAMAQKRILATGSRLRKPVIIATEMLDSMQHALQPTRAEVTDVANAILDGADACMLSGETAIGRHPVEAVRMMHRIALATEPLYRQRPPLPKPDPSAEGVDEITEATAYAAGRIAEQLDAKMVVVASATGETALSLSKNRNFVPTVGVSDSEATLRRMCLYWGVIPLAGAPTTDNQRLLDFVIALAGTPTHDSTALLRHVTDWGCGVGCLQSGDRVVLLTGSGVTGKTHNMIQVREVP
jgi:pyruvate kinase